MAKYKDLIIYLLRDNNLYKDELKTECESLFADLGKLIDLRNRIIHSFWVMGEDGNLKRAKYKKHVGESNNILTEDNLTLDDINNLPNDLLDAVRKLAKFNKKILALI